MNTLHIYRGVPASGKTTEALKYATTDKALRISRDDIRHASFGRYWGMDEQLVTKLFNAQLLAAMDTGMDVISDNTNLVAKHVRSQMEAAQRKGYKVEVYDFPVALHDALARDALRDKRVGEDVLRSFFKRFIGKDGLSLPPVPTVQPTPTFEPYVAPGPGKLHAILVDIDGTLAHHDGIRHPHDTTKYHLDKFDKVVANVAFEYVKNHDQYCKVIVMSGRDATYMKVTKDWLQKHGFLWHEIHMRPAGDRREDSVVKNELFEQHIAGKYNVDFILDDRNRVVNMWRKKGLKVLQVADGEF